MDQAALRHWRPTSGNSPRNAREVNALSPSRAHSKTSSSLRPSANPAEVYTGNAKDNNDFACVLTTTNGDLTLKISVLGGTQWSEDSGLFPSWGGTIILSTPGSFFLHSRQNHGNHIRHHSVTPAARTVTILRLFRAPSGTGGDLVT